MITEPAEMAVPRVYTCQSVEDYLGAVADKRIELEVAIARARARLERATELEQRIESLEQKVGEWIVLALALRRDPDASPGPLHLAPPGLEARVLPAVPPTYGVDGAERGAGAVPDGAPEVHAIDRLERLQLHLEHLRSSWPERDARTPTGATDPESDHG